MNVARTKSPQCFRRNPRDPGHSGTTRSIVPRTGQVRVAMASPFVIVCIAADGPHSRGDHVGIAFGDYPLTSRPGVGALVGDPDAEFAQTVVVEWRLPRAVAAVFFGAALGVSGAVFQSLTRNPLASPDIIGFSAGSYTGALVVIILIHGSTCNSPAEHCSAESPPRALVYLLAWRRGVQGFRLIIIGIAVSAVLTIVQHLAACSPLTSKSPCPPRPGAPVL